MPSGIYKRKPPSTSTYFPGAIIQTPKGSIEVLEFYPKGHRGASNSRALIRFIETGSVVNVQTSNIKAGKIRDPRHRSVYGVGYLDMDTHVPQRGAVLRNLYDLWANMLKRVYGGYDSGYEDCSVDTRWHSFLNFVNTIHEVPGYSEWASGQPRELDKDIKYQGNRVYSRDTCLFVTPEQNLADCLSRRRARN